ncbi:MULTISPECIES: flavin reductase family protein [unclassified Isoptericola]|uniref:flavin reductase family protein n=1 Tax=unclassified Isoptericola TaxID=2623355 RepID=UPI002712D5A8|nr:MULTISPECIES: flavin reductase family protein [unclassified Isoptericola]MDO8145914.1 flavin reductase family protein [Isoptericola sp. 178]MDO8147765.1 flavin reductase family protein [Isoptericola sp. b515]
MSRFATGVTVFSTCGEHAHAMTANSFTSLSCDPPLVLGCVAASARMHALLAPGACLGVSILAGGQEPIARHFADRGRPRGWRQFGDLSWWCGQSTGVPLIAGAAAWLECEVEDVHPGGDHGIVVARVLGCGEGAPEVLTFFDGGFRELGTPGPVPVTLLGAGAGT